MTVKRKSAVSSASTAQENVEEMGKWLVKNIANCRNAAIAHLSVISPEPLYEADTDNYYTISGDQQKSRPWITVSTSSPITKYDFKKGCGWQNFNRNATPFEWSASRPCINDNIRFSLFVVLAREKLRIGNNKHRQGRADKTSHTRKAKCNDAGCKTKKMYRYRFCSFPWQQQTITNGRKVVVMTYVVCLHHVYFNCHWTHFREIEEHKF